MTATCRWMVDSIPATKLERETRKVYPFEIVLPKHLGVQFEAEGLAEG